MRSKWTCTAFTLVILSGCVTQPAYVPKTDEQVAQESLNKTVKDMTSRGASQAEIDRIVAHSKLSYEDQLRDSIKPSNISDPAENLVNMINSSLFYCDLQRNSLKIITSQDNTSKTERKLVQCIATTSNILSSYYYKQYMPYSPSDTVKSASDETYLKWDGYLNSILQNSPTYLQEQASLNAKDQISRFQQVHLREVISKVKK